MKDTNTKETNKNEHELAAPLPGCVHTVMPSWEKGKKKKKKISEKKFRRKKK